MCRRCGTHPAFIGPIMIHYRKTFSSYLFFSSALVGIRQSLSALRSFSTDGESALIKAFKHSFPSAIHLLCSNHVRRNVKDKLHALRISESAKTTIVSDIFGQHIEGCHFEGLVDAKSNSEFEDGVSTLTAKWAQLDDLQQGPVKRFVSWFLAYKKDDIQARVDKASLEESLCWRSTSCVHNQCQREYQCSPEEQSTVQEE